jgi:hypothetical protein
MARAIQSQINASLSQLEPDAGLERATAAVESLAAAYDDGSAASRLSAQIEALNRLLTLVESTLARFILEREQSRGDHP